MVHQHQHCEGDLHLSMHQRQRGPKWRVIYHPLWCLEIGLSGLVLHGTGIMMCSVIIEEGNAEGRRFKFRTHVVDDLPFIGAPFSKNPSMHISSTLSKQIPTTYNSSINMNQVHVLVSSVTFLNDSGNCHIVAQKVRAASSGVKGLGWWISAWHWN